MQPTRPAEMFATNSPRGYAAASVDRVRPMNDLRPTPSELKVGIPDREPDWRVSVTPALLVEVNRTAWAQAVARIEAASCGVREHHDIVEGSLTVAGWYAAGQESEGADAFAEILRLAFPDRFA